MSIGGVSFMLDKVTNAESAATNGALAGGSELSTTLASGSGRDAWFFDAAQVLLGKDAGYTLHLITGYAESSCYAYTAKNSDKRRPVPEHMLRKLIHSEQGEPWLRAFMEGCDASWWADLQHALALKRAIDGVGK